MRQPVLFCLLLLLSLTSNASLNSKQAELKLKRIDAKIGVIKERLTGFQQQQQQTESTLAKTDKKIDKIVRHIARIERGIDKKQRAIQDLQQQIEALNTQRAAHQAALARQLRMIDMLGASQPVKGLLMADAPEAVDRWLVFYQYLIRARKHCMDELQLTQNKLAQAEQHLEAVLETKEKLSQRLHRRETHLQKVKVDQAELIQQLSKSINTHQHRLKHYERDKANLTVLLEQLLKANDVKSAQGKRMPAPLAGGYTSVTPLRQGLMFLSKEGEPVIAVQGGKVVFSDWLRGYGLLLIIDHGGGWMSLYGHNQALYKHAGQWVHAGDRIASVGHSGGQRENGVYFEVRRQGHVVSARHWLMAHEPSKLATR